MWFRGDLTADLLIYGFEKALHFLEKLVIEMKNIIEFYFVPEAIYFSIKVP